jgi:hypothetical protein
MRRRGPSAAEGWECAYGPPRAPGWGQYHSARVVTRLFGREFSMPVLDAVFVGKIHLPEVGGGPIYPPVGGGSPPGIWGPPGPWPTPPIYLPPVGGGSPPVISGGPGWLPPYPMPPIYPGGQPPVVMPPIYYPPVGGGSPPGIWGGPGSLPSYPMPPIYLPEPPTEPPSDTSGGRWVFLPGTGWVYVIVPSGGGDKPQQPGDPNAPVVTPHSP